MSRVITPAEMRAWIKHTWQKCRDEAWGKGKGMTNEEVMNLMTDMGLHEGGMENWVMDNAWVEVAKRVAAHEREECAKVCESGIIETNNWDVSYWNQACENAAFRIRARGEK